MQDPNAYTLSLAHMGDLTLNSFAYLRLPLVVAGLAFAVGAIGAWRAAFSAPRRLSGESKTPVLALTLMMVLFFHAARIALVVFDPYLSSRPLAEALLKSPPGELIVDDQYYTFSSVFFYTDRRALLLNGRINNLEYGSTTLRTRPRMCSSPTPSSRRSGPNPPAAIWSPRIPRSRGLRN